MNARPSILGIVLVSLAVAVALVLGTLGWFAVGFGVMTSCTSEFSCTETGCPPCATTEWWLDLGALVQWVLAAVGGAVLAVGIARRWGGLLLAWGLALVLASVLTMVATTGLAREAIGADERPRTAPSGADPGSVRAGA